MLWFRQPLSERLWPDTRAQQLLVDAESALQQGRLTAPDGSGARELYEAALALDPDRMDTRDGLARVGRAALDRARLALAERRYTDAQDALTLARQLMVPAAEADALARQLSESRLGTGDIDRLLAFAAAARAAGRLEGSDNAALPLYQRALALQPHNTQALEGREDTLSDLLQHGLRILARGDIAEAAAVLERVRVADSGHVDLPDAHAALAAVVEQRLREGDAAWRDERLPQARDAYAQALAGDPDHQAATQGLNRVADAYAGRSTRRAADFRFAEAEADLREAQRLAGATPGPAIAEAQRALVRARQSQARLAGEATVVPGTARQRGAQLRALLAEAAAAEARGDLLTPPGDSAFDKLRAARSLAPRDPAVQNALTRLLPAARRCFENELRGNGLTRAGACLDARAALGEAPPELRDARQRLAQRWVAIGEQRLGAGEVAGAAAAAASARALDPRTPGLDALAARVQAASIPAD